MSTTHDLTALVARLRGHVETLASAPRAPGSPEHRQAAEYIAHHLAAAGLTVQHPCVRVAGLTVRNLLTDPVPSQVRGPLVLIGAHYDSLPDTPGADDNASGVAALLELAHWLRPHLEQASARSCRV